MMKNNIIWIILFSFLLGCGQEEIIQEETIELKDLSKGESLWISSPQEIDFSSGNTGLKIKDVKLLDIYGISMQPFAFEGNKVIARKYKGEDLKVGDIVKFKDDNHFTGYTMHQIVWTDGINYQTKGFNNENIDSKYITKEDIEDIILGVLLT